MNEQEKDLTTEQTIQAASVDADEINEEVSEESDALHACQLELEQLKDTYKRVAADFENAKRRLEREREQWTRVAQAEVLIGLLKIVDDFERALKEKEREDLAPELEPWFEGFSLINKEFDKYLKKVGIVQVPTKVFDPEMHEALMSVESDQESGSIIEVFEKGYMFKDNVLRPAKVSVAK